MIANIHFLSLYLLSIVHSIYIVEYTQQLANNNIQCRYANWDPQCTVPQVSQLVESPV